MKYEASVIGMAMFLHVLRATSLQFEIKAASEHDIKRNVSEHMKMIPVVVNTWPFTNATQQGSLRPILIQSNRFNLTFRSLEGTVSREKIGAGCRGGGLYRLRGRAVRRYRRLRR